MRQLKTAEGSEAAGARRLAVEVVDTPGPAWDEMTARFDDATYEQSAVYAARRWGARRLLGLVLRDTRRSPVAAALAVTAVVPLVSAGVAYVKFGPLWRPKGREPSVDVLVRALIGLREELAERRGLLVRVMPPAAPDLERPWQDALTEAGFVRSKSLWHPERYLLDLSLPASEQLASFSQRWRAALRKAATDLRFEEPTGAGCAEEFVTLFRSMLRRKHFKNRHGLDTLPDLLAHPVAAHRVRLFVARHDGKSVAASIIGGAGDTLHVLFSATSDDALPLRAGYALRWWVLNRLRDSGARWLDLGGDEGDDGLRHFKEGEVGKRGRVVALPGEFDWCDRPLSRLIGGAIGLVRDAKTRPGISRLWRKRGERLLVGVAERA